MWFNLSFKLCPLLLSTRHEFHVRYHKETCIKDSIKHDINECAHFSTRKDPPPLVRPPHFYLKPNFPYPGSCSRTKLGASHSLCRRVAHRHHSPWYTNPAFFLFLSHSWSKFFFLDGVLPNAYFHGLRITVWVKEDCSLLHLFTPFMYP